MPPITALTYPPRQQVVQLVYDPFALGYVQNQLVVLQKQWTKCFKIASGQSNNGPFLNNVFLHFSPIDRNNAVFGNGAGLVVNAAITIDAYPLEITNIGIRYQWGFCKGLPSLVYLSADYQGDGAHTDLICFTDDTAETVQGIQV